MMKWMIPAKTFLVGEYVALQGGPAIVLTTKPCFELVLSTQVGLIGIHPDSPAGRWWLSQNRPEMGLHWQDPYAGCGGLGASSAQFLGAYLAGAYLEQYAFEINHLLDAYAQSAWRGEGLPPSGYDVLAQYMQGCAYLHHQQKHYQSEDWPFQDLAFIALHTGKKLQTHEHLKELSLLTDLGELHTISKSAHQAFLGKDRKLLIDAVNAYYRQLCVMNLVAEHTQMAINNLMLDPNILAAKGCGALGADVILILISEKFLDQKQQQLSGQGWRVIATSRDMTRNSFRCVRDKKH